MADTATIEDVRHRLALAEAALRDRQDHYRTVFEAIDDGFCIVEVCYDGRDHPVDLLFIEVNPAFERQTGLTDVVGKRASEVVAGVEGYWLAMYGDLARGGEARRVENFHVATDRWYDVYAARVVNSPAPRVCIVFKDITDRKRAENALRDGEARQAFLLKLSDTLRPLVEAEAIQRAAARLVAEHWDMPNANYGRIEARQGVPYALVRHGYAAAGRLSLDGEYPLSDFPGVIARLQVGEKMIVPEIAADPHLTDTEKATYAAMDVANLLVVPLVKGGRLAAVFAVHGPAPKSWTEADVLLLEEVAERTWASVERARAEAAQRESEARFQQFALASASALWIRDAATLRMEYASPAISRLLGVEAGMLMDGIAPWAAAIVPDDRADALARIEAARRGESVMYEFRIQRPADRSFRWIRDITFPLRDESGHVERIGGIAGDVTDAKLAAEHTAVLLAELQHRVRNIMAMIRSITVRTGEGATSVAEYAALLCGRLMSLARVQAVLTRADNAGVGITGLVRGELDAQAQHAGQYTLDGPEVVLSPKATEVLTLAIHELATNALKYGALSTSRGHVTVRWAVFDRRGASWLGFDWIEEGAPERAPPDPAVPRRRGFGSELIEARIPYELGGRGTAAIEAGGARCRLEFPLRDGDSILETDAPRRATVFGGALDMTGEADLSGQHVLVVEDDYYLASDTARALRGAGAGVLGPCPTEAAARDELEERRPDAAVIDINLGSGPSFTLAEILMSRGIPFLFMTGYDIDVIPAAFETVERLQKPVELRQIVAAVARLIANPA